MRKGKNPEDSVVGFFEALEVVLSELSSRLPQSAITPYIPYGNI